MRARTNQNTCNDQTYLTCHKEVEGLNGRLSALNRFLFEASDQAPKLFQILRVNKKFKIDN